MMWKNRNTYFLQKYWLSYIQLLIFAWFGVLLLGWSWSTWPTGYSWDCGPAGELFFLHNNNYPESSLMFWSVFTMQECSVSGPTWSQRFTRPDGRCRRQSKSLLKHNHRIFMQPLITHNVNICKLLHWQNVFLSSSVGPAWFQRQTWRRRHHWKDSESLLVCYAPKKKKFGSSCTARIYGRSHQWIAVCV